MNKNTKRVKKTFRSLRISEGLIKTFEKFLKSKEAKRLGIETLKDAIEYYARKGLQS